MGYKYSTMGAHHRSRSATCSCPEGKDEMIRRVREEGLPRSTRKYKRGLITDQERYRLTVAELGRDHQEGYRKALQANLPEQRYNPISHDG